MLGNGTWGACGSGGGTGNVSTAPVANQNVAQPEGTQFSANNLANVRYVTASWNWVQSPADGLATAGSNTIHLNPCPMGIDTSNNPNRPYYVYVAGTGTPETALVTGGTCASGAASGTMVVTTGSNHAAGYTVGFLDGRDSGRQERRSTRDGDRVDEGEGPTVGTDRGDQYRGADTNGGSIGCLARGAGADQGDDSGP